MHKVSSPDGTTIAFDVVGDGPPVIFVVGAFNERPTAAPLAEALASGFTGYTYDRRGRGDSGDTLPYAVEREVDDIAALIGAAGGSAALFGFSSGAILALKAAQAGLPVTALALYDPPPLGDTGNADQRRNMAAELTDLVATGRRGDAVEYFQSNVVGLPEEMVRALRNAPFRPSLERIAHTLVYEVSIMADTSIAAGLAELAVPTLAMAGEVGPPVLRDSARAVAAAVPQGQYRELAGQTHDLVPEVLAPVLSTFLVAA